MSNLFESLHAESRIKDLYGKAIKARFGISGVSETNQPIGNYGDEVIYQEDAKLKLLEKSPSAWNNITLIIRNKSDLDTLSMDDLYNNLKVYESEIKGQSSSSSNSQNVAFVSSENLAQATNGSQ
ncbi:hypothetical protein Tco_0005654 [Tanacetum coccineum]